MKFEYGKAPIKYTNGVPSHLAGEWPGITSCKFHSYKRVIHPVNCGIIFNEKEPLAPCTRKLLGPKGPTPEYIFKPSCKMVKPLTSHKDRPEGIRYIPCPSKNPEPRRERKHNFEYKDDGKCSFYNLIKERRYQERLEAFVRENNLKTITIQGELCAPGIQRNRLKLSKPEWYVFTIRENGKRVGLRRMQEVCNKLQMEMVPIEEVDFDLPSKYSTVESLLDRADGNYPCGTKKEGIVIRPTEPVFCELISAALSMKVVNNKYLLKND